MPWSCSAWGYTVWGGGQVFRYLLHFQSVLTLRIFGPVLEQTNPALHITPPPPQEKNPNQQTHFWFCLRGRGISFKIELCCAAVLCCKMYVVFRRCQKSWIHRQSVLSSSSLSQGVLLSCRGAGNILGLGLRLRTDFFSMDGITVVAISWVALQRIVLTYVYVSMFLGTKNCSWYCAL